MAKQIGHIKLIGTYGNLCFYMSKGVYYARMASNLTAKRVKTDKKFMRTMEEATLLGRASRIASLVYNSLPADFRQFWMFRSFTGEASRYLRKGESIEDTIMILWNTYAEAWMNKESNPVVDPVSSGTCKKGEKTSLVVTRSGRLSEISRPLYQYEMKEIILPFSVFVSSHQMIRRRRIDGEHALLLIKRDCSVP